MVAEDYRMETETYREPIFKESAILRNNNLGFYRNESYGRRYGGVRYDKDSGRGGAYEIHKENLGEYVDTGGQGNVLGSGAGRIVFV